MRERLIELICEAAQEDNCVAHCNYPPCNKCKSIADHLLANGVIVPPCKVGQKVYVVSRYYTGTWEIYECDVDSITTFEKCTFLAMSSKGKLAFGEEVSQIGKTVFLTREEAEEVLAERSKG